MDLLKVAAVATQALHKPRSLQTINQIYQVHSEESNNISREARVEAANKSRSGKDEEALIPSPETAGAETESIAEGDVENEMQTTMSIRSIGSLLCRICHNSENPEK